MSNICMRCRFSPIAEGNDHEPCISNRDYAGLGPCVNGNGFMPTGTLGCETCGNGVIDPDGQGGTCNATGACDTEGGTPTFWVPQQPVMEPATEPEPVVPTEPERPVGDSVDQFNELLNKAKDVLAGGGIPVDPVPAEMPTMERVDACTLGAVQDSLSVQETPPPAPPVYHSFDAMFKQACLNAQKVSTDLDKTDAFKLEYSLFPREVMRYVVAVMTYGKIKYSANGWKSIEDRKRRYADAGERHKDSRMLDDEVFDAESGLPHCVHELTNKVFEVFAELQDLGLITGEN